MARLLNQHPWTVAIMCLLGVVAGGLAMLWGSGIVQDVGQNVLPGVFPPGHARVDPSRWDELPVAWPTTEPLPPACNISGPLPDPRCTKDTTVSWIGQNAIKETVCEPLWVQNQQDVLLPPRVADQVRARLAATYGKGDPRNWRLALLIPFGLAGNPFYGNFMLLSDDVWRVKKAVDDAANRAVCTGQMTLLEAQAEEQANWPRLGRKLGVNVPASVG